MKAIPKKGFSQIALLAGPVLFAVLLCFRPESVDLLSWQVLAVAAWMLVWWFSETVNLAVTALLPMILFPLLGVMPLNDVSANYANPMVYLFFGGFVLALAIEKWQLHRRIALHIIAYFGATSSRLLLGFMAATAFLSMWISNTATAVMMLPIAMSVIHIIDPLGNKKQSTLMLISIAWAANIGGIATLIGTPPNLVFAGFVAENYEEEIHFSQWLVIGLPVATLLLLGAYGILRSYMPRSEALQSTLETQVVIQKEIKKLGPLNGPERRVAIVFIATALAWIFRQQLVGLTGIAAISDTAIAMAAALVLFTLPGDGQSNKRLLAWNDTRGLSWGILILFGGGLALAAGIQQSAWVLQLGDIIGTDGLQHAFLVVLVLAAIGVFLTEILSNLALVAALLPVIAAATTGRQEFIYLALPITIGASCAFMLPMATPPNAIVFSSERISMMQMARYGFLLNLLSVVVVTLAVYFLKGI